MDKRFWAIIGVIVVIFGGILLFKGGDKATAPTSVQPTKHITGSSKNGITLTEYGDYQCPGCGSYYPLLKQVIESRKSDIEFQFRNLPLSQIHQNAFAAARAAEAAALQNKFWEYHDLLYETQKIWSEQSNAPSYFEQYAGQLGLNIEKFKNDSASKKVNDLINADVAAFKATGNDMATPSFFLNGKKIDTEANVDFFNKLIDNEIAKKAKNQKP